MLPVESTGLLAGALQNLPTLSSGTEAVCFLQHLPTSSSARGHGGRGDATRGWGFSARGWLLQGGGKRSLRQLMQYSSPL